MMPDYPRENNRGFADEFKPDMHTASRPLLAKRARSIVADALNEQGFLFQHKVNTVLLAHEKAKKPKHHWQLEATEVPVSFAGGETRIDLVLHLGAENRPPVRAVVECKRSNREHKRWIFFAQTEINQAPSPNSYYAERAHLRNGYNGHGDPDIIYTVESKPATPDCPVFDYGIEARLNRPGGSNRVSATNAIEDAFQQITLGQAGLGGRLRMAHVFNFRILPVVATTAELMSAHFDERRVTLDRGDIDAKNLKLQPRKWLAANYRISQSISLCVPMAYGQIIHPGRLAVGLGA